MLRALGMLSMMIILFFFGNNVAQARYGYSIATGIMGMTNSTTQGGQGSKGSTFLSETDISYHHGWWGFGIFGQYDTQGTSEVNVAAGPRLEMGFHQFYMEAEYAAVMNRTFTDRAIAEQTGNGLILGIGARFHLGGPSADGGGGGGGADAGGATGHTKGAFMQFSYKYRTQTIIKQDSIKLDQKIVQIDGYPLFGIGVGF